MTKKSNKRLLGLMLASAVLVSGCGNSGIPSANEAGENNANAENTTGSTAMGRYVETEITFPSENLSVFHSDFVLMEDGSYQMATAWGTKLVSMDQGETWETQPLEWMEPYLNGYISQIEVNSLGEYIMTYDPPEEETKEESTQTSEDESYNPQYLYVDEEGKASDIPISYEDSAGWIYGFRFLPDGQIIGWTNDETVNIYDKTTGAKTELFNLENERFINDICVVGNSLFVEAGNSIYVYDMETKLLTEADSVLTDFFREEDLYNSASASGQHEYLIIPDQDEGSMYFACRSGVYRYVTGGNVIEQIINGELTSLSDLSRSLAGMIKTENGDFLILYTGGILQKYTYNKDIPSVPSSQLKVYSLEENKTVRQAVNVFQKENPDMYVSYEIGMSQDDAVTYDDAVKNLNVELLAGKGPDVIIMDGLDVENYEEQGILMDLSVALEDQEEELFSNLARVYQRGENLYAVPAKIRLPMILGKNNLLSNITDLTGLADAVEQSREMNPDISVLDVADAEQLLTLLSISSSGTWEKNGEIDEDALREFLTQAKRIYQIEKPEETVQDDINWGSNGNSSYSVAEQKMMREAKYIITYGDMSYKMGERALLCGYLTDLTWEFPDMVSVIWDQEDSSYGLLNLQNKECFNAVGIMAVNAKSIYTDEAVLFLKTMLGEEVQSVSLGDGLPINKAAFEQGFVGANGVKPGESFGRVGISDEDGNKVTLDIYWPKTEDFEKLESLVMQLKTANNTDKMLLDTVLELAPLAIKGEKDVDSVVEEICNRMQIKMAE